MSEPLPSQARPPSAWTAPVVLGILMSAGLVVALIGDGVWDTLACLLLASVAGYAGFRAFSRKR